MPTAGIYGRGSKRPMAFASYDVGGGSPGRMGGGGAGIGASQAPRPFAAAPMGAAGGGSALSRFPSLGAFGLGGGNAPAWLNGTATPKAAQVFDPNDPFKGALNLQDPIRNLLAQGGRGGVFNRDYLTSLMRKRAIANADSGRRRSALMAQFAGLDPMQYRGAMVDADIGANQGTVAALNQAELDDASQYRDMILNFLNRERYGVEAPGEEANIGRRFEEEQRGGLGGFLGQAAGSALGSWLSPGGIARGRGNR